VHHTQFDLQPGGAEIVGQHDDGRGAAVLDVGG
jgi:hypothetical protein